MLYEHVCNAIWQGLGGKLCDMFTIITCIHSWEINRSSASEEITCLSWNLNVHYRVHNSPPLAPVQSQMNPIHPAPPYFFKICFNNILPYIPRSSERPLLLRFRYQNFVRIPDLSATHCVFGSYRPYRCWRVINKVEFIIHKILFKSLTWYF
jgi:hypothetical protein